MFVSLLSRRYRLYYRDLEDVEESHQGGSNVKSWDSGVWRSGIPYRGRFAFCDARFARCFEALLIKIVVPDSAGDPGLSRTGLSEQCDLSCGLNGSWMVGGCNNDHGGELENLGELKVVAQPHSRAKTRPSGHLAPHRRAQGRAKILPLFQLQVQKTSLQGLSMGWGRCFARREGKAEATQNIPCCLCYGHRYSRLQTEADGGNAHRL